MRLLRAACGTVLRLISPPLAHEMAFVYTGPPWAVDGVIGAVQGAGNVLTALPPPVCSHECSIGPKNRGRLG